MSHNYERSDIDWNSFRKSYQAAIMHGDSWLSNQRINLLEYETRLSWLSSFPTTIIFPLTNKCNARCVFCLNQNLDASDHLTEEYLNQFFLPVLPYLKTFEISGNGEPTVHPNCYEILEILFSLLDERINSRFITNGLKLDKKLAELFIRHSLNLVQVSLNAASGKTYRKIVGVDGFDEVLTNIRLLKELKERTNSQYPAIVISCVVNMHNIDEIDNFLKLADKLGVDGVNITPLAPMDIKLLSQVPHKDYYGDFSCNNYKKILERYKRLLPKQEQTRKLVLDLSRLNQEKMPFRLCFSKENFVRDKLLLSESYASKEAQEIFCEKPWTDVNLYLLEPFYATCCCYATNIKYQNISTFQDFWNGTFMSEMRRSFRVRQFPSKCIATCGDKRGA